MVTTSNDEQGRPTVQIGDEGQDDPPLRRPRRLRMVLLTLSVLLVIFIVPPMISIGRYKSRVTQAISQAFGRPVRLSSVELRLLPWPGFVLNNLSVAEDPAYGAEPVLHANTVTANIRLLPLWRGRLEFSSVSVDEASLNVVRAAPGRWNLDPLLRTAAVTHGAKGGGEAHRFPYLEATNSRINFKDGAEKLPFSLVNAELSMWQENPGEWRLRLRGQPVRTDVVLDMADTGIVRLEASVHRAPELRNMPLSINLDWREAQLGQLSRLLVGSDPGWRGDLTGELHIQGTPAAAQVTARLRATGVHRAEFAPASPLDFDANCAFVYHYEIRALDNLVCNSPLGDGHFRLSGDIPGAGAAPSLVLELDRIPTAAGLDLLRTMRSGIDSDLEASGTVSGKLVYNRDAEENAPAVKPRRGPLTGSLTVAGFALSGGSLSLPLRVPKIVLEPEPASPAGQPRVLEGAMTFPAGGTEPLVVDLKLALFGYRAAIHGQASISRAREIAGLDGSGGAALLDDLAGEPLTADVVAEGPWLPSEPGPAAAPALPAQAVLPQQPGKSAAPAPGSLLKTTAKRPSTVSRSVFDRDHAPGADTVSGSITLHNANWQADYLANHVQIAEATLHLGEDRLVWSPVAFSYGPVKGTAGISWPLHCDPSLPEAAAHAPCAARFEAQFGELDAADAEAALLGAQEKNSLFSGLIARFHLESAPLWPAIEGTVKADSLVLGPVKLAKASATVKIADDGAVISALHAGLLGGRLRADATMHWSGNGQTGPAYTLTAQLDRLSPAAVGRMLDRRWSGGLMQLRGNLNLSGFTARHLAATAQGALHFNWRGGKMARPGAAATGEPGTRFTAWTGDARIGNGAITLAQNELLAAGRKFSVNGAITFAKPPKVKFAAARQPASAKKNSAPKR